MSQSRRRFLCLDCGVDCGKIGEYFMLVDNVWFSVADSNRGMLCISCLELRLGRKLIASDFNSSYLNRLNFGIKSVRLLERLRSIVKVGRSFWRYLEKAKNYLNRKEDTQAISSIGQSVLLKDFVLNIFNSSECQHVMGVQNIFLI